MESVPSWLAVTGSSDIHTDPRKPGLWMKPPSSIDKGQWFHLYTLGGVNFTSFHMHILLGNILLHLLWPACMLRLPTCSIHMYHDIGIHGFHSYSSPTATPVVWRTRRRSYWWWCIPINSNIVSSSIHLVNRTKSYPELHYVWAQTIAIHSPRWLVYPWPAFAFTYMCACALQNSFFSCYSYTHTHTHTSTHKLTHAHTHTYTNRGYSIPHIHQIVRDDVGMWCICHFLNFLPFLKPEPNKYNHATSPFPFSSLPAPTV